MAVTDNRDSALGVDFGAIAIRDFDKVIARRNQDIEASRPEIDDRLAKRFGRKGQDYHGLPKERRDALAHDEAAFESQTTIIVLKDGTTTFGHANTHPAEVPNMIAHASLFHKSPDTLAARFEETSVALKSYQLGAFELKAPGSLKL
jgi:hypothetical protein